MMQTFILFPVVFFSISFAQIPPNVFQAISEDGKTADDFLRNFIRRGDDNTTDVGDGITFNPDGTPTTGARGDAENLLATSGACEPKLKDVPIEVDPNPNVLTWPICTPVLRCGGCCGGGDSLECYPTSTNILRKHVMSSEYKASIGKFVAPRMKVVTIIEHTDCGCKCRVKPEDCTARHRYNRPNCKCECLNENEARDCTAKQRWDNHNCRCACKKVKECEQGLVFNHNSCSCELPARQREGAGFNTGSVQRRPNPSNNVEEVDEVVCADCPDGYRQIRLPNGHCDCFYDIFGLK